jgi:hypothetical protein
MWAATWPTSRYAAILPSSYLPSSRTGATPLLDLRCHRPTKRFGRETKSIPQEMFPPDSPIFPRFFQLTFLRSLAMIGIE